MDGRNPIHCSPPCYPFSRVRNEALYLRQNIAVYSFKRQAAEFYGRQPDSVCPCPAFPSHKAVVLSVLGFKIKPRPAGTVRVGTSLVSREIVTYLMRSYCFDHAHCWRSTPHSLLHNARQLLRDLFVFYQCLNDAMRNLTTLIFERAFAKYVSMGRGGTSFSIRVKAAW